MSLLRVTGLKVSTGEDFTLDELSFEVPTGSLTALIGPNGCGKSTLLKAIAGILPTQSGLLHYQGQELRELSRHEQAMRVLYLGSELRAEFPISAFEVVLLAAKLSFPNLSPEELKSRAQVSLQRAECFAHRDRDIRTLSQGERQLVAIARALAQGSRLLLLDETLSPMDLHHQQKMGALLNHLRAEGYSILLVSHDLNLATEWADQIILMAQGRILAKGAPTTVLTRENLGLCYPSARLEVVPHPAGGAPRVFFSRG